MATIPGAVDDPDQTQLVDQASHLKEHCVPVNELYCSLFCDQFVPISLFIVAYIDLKIIAVCYDNC